MVSKNSAEYEPWTNPAERTMRTLQEPMRVMLARGHAGPEYWEFAMSQARYIADDSHHSWGREDDGKTPTERRTGHPPSIAGRFRPMFCLAYVLGALTADAAGGAGTVYSRGALLGLFELHFGCQKTPLGFLWGLPAASCELRSIEDADGSHTLPSRGLRTASFSRVT